MASLTRIHLPLLRPEDVIPHLGKGELHWRDGYSAKAVCESRFNANDIPSVSATGFGRCERVSGCTARRCLARTVHSFALGTRKSDSD